MSSSSTTLQASILQQIPTSPQVIQTLRNLQKITQINVDSSDFKSLLKRFGQEHMVLYKLHTNQEDSSHYICFVEDQRDGDLYIHQLTGETFRVEPLEGSILEIKQSDKAKIDQTNLQHLKNIYLQLKNYLNRCFSGPYAATCHFKIDSGIFSQIIIGLTNKHTNPTNFSFAEWTSNWSFKSTEYSAKITSRNHFHQAGNVIFQRPKTIHKTLSGQKCISMNNLTQQAINYIITVIENQERLYQKQLEKIYSQKLTQSIKKLRRISPLTQGKMIWNVNAVLLSEGLNQKLPNLA